MSKAIQAIAAKISMEGQQKKYTQILKNDNKRQAADIEAQLGLPSNSTSIRANIVDTFSCDGKIYGYYADPDNECQIFHICMPDVFPDGREETRRWSFVCPEETIFDQSHLVCARPEDALPCEEAVNFYNVNENFGKIPEPSSSK
ncbi:unnamed protein product [Notodromas monacha]|uniref:Chitin-binding type-2 domain-containing protein n=1 Tax=Notodromas monacha TaxID=399045 RepID=A0A7R9BMN3_9CRUS|nr:unnamed protein product [Notodromas monacha]CAG0918314.1 unnamed protein product [Notodromas monacha]